MRTLVISRASLKRERDYKFTMRQARARFKTERHLPIARGGFHVWARKTYNPNACTGKLKEIVER